MPSLEVRLLGGLDVRVGGEPLPPIPRAGRALLSYLLLHRDHRVTREAAAATFWPDLDASRAKRRLSHTLWQIQDTLGEHPAASGWLVAEPVTLRLAPDRAWIDIEEFERRLERLRPATGTVPDWRRADLADLAETVELYRGDLLPDVYEPWATAERERLAQLHLDALGWLVAMSKSQGDYEEALVYARRITHLEPLREDAHREVMKLCTLLGRPSDALRQYERVESVLREELGASPAAETRSLRAFITQQRQEPEPTPRGEDETTPALRLVGRERERRTGVAALERALGGDASLVLVEGEPGIGKSRLAEELADAARWRGFTVLVGAASTGVREPYGPLVGALEHELTPVRIEQLRPHVDGVWLTTAAGVLPHLRRAGGAAPGRLHGRDQALRVREALARTVLGLAAVDPTLLVLEDLHEADEETLEVVERLVRGLDRQRLTVLVTYRSAEARQREVVWRALRLIDEAAAPDRIDLAPLDPAAVAELARHWIGAAPPAGLSHRLFRETGGNPLFALETLLTLRQAGSLDPDRDAELPVAGSVRELIAGRLEQLEAPVREVLRAASLRPAGVDIELLIAALAERQDPREVAGHAASLTRRGLLLEDGDILRFRHEVLRRTVEEGLGDREARTLHGALADAVRTRHPDRPADLALHLEAAGRAAEAVVAHHDAGRSAVSLHAYATAGAHLRRARELAQVAPVEVTRRQAVLADLEGVLDVLGDRELQHTVLAELTELVGADDPTLVRRRAWLAWSTDDLATAEAAARQALDVAAALADRADAATVLARAVMAQGRPDEGIAALETMLATVAPALAPGDLDAVARLASAHLVLGAALAERTRYDEGRHHLDRAVALAEEAGDVRTLVDARTTAGAIEAQRGNRQGAVVAYREALARCRELGYRYGEAVALVNVAMVSWDLPANALEHLTVAARAFRELGNDRGAAIALTNRAFVRHLDLGDDVAAGADASEAGAFFRRAGDAASAAVSAAVEAAAAATRGDLPRAKALVEDTPVPDDPWARVELATGAARVALAAGEPVRALAEARAAHRIAEEAGSFSQLAPNATVLVDALLAAGEVDEALAVTDRILEDGREIERPHRLLWARHRALAAAGRDAEARTALGRAEELLRGLLLSLPSALRPAAERVGVHAAILAGVEADATAPLVLELAAAEAPTGRSLTADELVRVEVLLPDVSDDDVRVVRETHLEAIVAAAGAAGAVCTVEDLADALDVSVSTVRRDLRRLRAGGADLPTRGRRAG